MFYNVYNLNYNFYNIIKFKKDITEKVCLVVLHGLAAADGLAAEFILNPIPMHMIWQYGTYMYIHTHVCTVYTASSTQS
jgi:hypothetical protein